MFKARARSGKAAFTLVEVLAALLLMAIVIPVVMQALHIASLAGEVSQRKAMAARVAEKVLNEAIVTGQWNTGSQNGTEMQGPYKFQWALRNEPWKPTVTGINAVDPNAFRQVSADVYFTAQGKDCTVRLSTLVNATQ